MKKLSFSLLLALLVPMVARAQKPYAVLSDDNSVLTFYFDDQKAERNGMDVGPFSSYPDYPSWYDNSSEITSVVFDESFANCTTLTSTAFWFYFFKNLSSITGISNLKTDNVTDMRSMFDGCSSLTSLDLSGFKTDNVTDMRYMFFECSSLTSLDLSGFKTDNVTSMEGMFYFCSSLTSLNVSGFKTDNVSNMWSMFQSCSSLTNLDVTGFKTDYVENVGEMFAYCSSLTSLDLTGFKTDNVSNMQSVFIGCSSLTTIYAGDGWSTAKVTSDWGTNMFYDCTSLVGGAGTRYDENHIDYTYARIDGGSNRPGYFTAKAEGDGISNVEAVSDKDVWYDMNGRKLQGKPAMRGVYMKNGKKVVIK